MSNFPALIPSTRTFSPGVYPHTAYQVIDGTENRVRHSNVFIDSTLRLQFINLTEAEMLSVLTHYKLKRGSYNNFNLPSEVLSGARSASDYQLQGYAWSYLESPQVEDLERGGHNVEVVLGTAVTPTADILPFVSVVTIALTAGKGRAANGASAAITVVLTPGQPGVFIDVPSVIRELKLEFRPDLTQITSTYP